MSTLILWKTETSEAAERAIRVLRELPDTERGSVHNAATVSWPRGSRTPTTRVLDDLGSDQALDEEFWGLLFGLIFYSPLIGAAVASNAEAFSGSFAGVGIDDTFVNRVRDAVTPGTSALFVLGSDAVVDRLCDAGGPGQPVRPLVARLNRRQEVALRQVFG